MEVCTNELYYYESISFCPAHNKIFLFLIRYAHKYCFGKNVKLSNFTTKNIIQKKLLENNLRKLILGFFYVVKGFVQVETAIRSWFPDCEYTLSPWARFPFLSLNRPIFKFGRFFSGKERKATTIRRLDDFFLLKQKNIFLY